MTRNEGDEEEDREKGRKTKRRGEIQRGVKKDRD
jgi:hypothetical protein